MALFNRSLYNPLLKKLQNYKDTDIIVIYGPRQVGKTTIVKKLVKEFKGLSNYLVGDNLITQQIFSSQNQELLIKSVQNYDLVVIDEAQLIPNIGVNLKLIYDSGIKTKIIATGSSSFDLANKINEPLTGRKQEFFLYPFSIFEFSQNQLFHLDFRTRLDRLLIYGLYPKVFDKADLEARNNIQEISGSYLFKDILAFENLKNPQLLTSLLQLLAHQIGNEVSYNELSQTLGVDQTTIQRYLDLLEKSFIVFRLNSFSRNLRNEIKVNKSRKFYFYDLGIRNSLVQNFNQLSFRNDLGGLWENFCILEKMKSNRYKNIYANYYFWRTYDQQEIDFIEERDGRLFGFEFKYNQHKSKNYRPPKIFLQTYKEYQPRIKVIDTESAWEWLQ